MPRFLRCLLLTTLSAAPVALAAAGPTGVLTLSGGDYYQGEWLDGGDPGVIRWRPGFVGEPFEFGWESVAYATLPPPRDAVLPRGAFRFELSGGDVVVGDLVNLSPEWFTVSATLNGADPPQQLRIPRGRVRGLVRAAQGDGGQNANEFYIGPDQLSAWDPSDEGDWQYAVGGLSTSASHASASRDVKLPVRALIEVELSWKRGADFSLELGVTKQAASTALGVFEVWIQGGDGKPKKVQEAQPLNAPGAPAESKQDQTEAFRIETVGGHLVAVQESAPAADLAPLRELAPGAGRVQLRLYLDQTANRLTVTTPAGEQLAELGVGGRTVRFGSGIKLTNREGDIRLDRLAVSPWNGAPPASVRGDQTRVTLKSGDSVHGELTDYRPEQGRLLVTPAADEPASGESDNDAEATEDEVDPTEPQATEVALDEVVSIVFPSGDSEEAAPEGAVLSVNLHNGLRITGAARGVEQERLRIASPNLDEELVVSLADVRAVRSASILPEDGVPAAKRKSLPRLETDDSRSVGVLSAGTEDHADRGDASCLMWRPEGSRNAAPLLDNVSGRLLFREPPPKPTTQAMGAAAPAPQQRQRGVLGAIASVFSFQPAEPSAAPERQDAVMYLRVGDKLPCTVNRIDDEGVYFSSPYSNSDFAPHNRVKAIELVTDGVDGRMTSAQRDKLLTLPRVRENDPPTHLLVSTKGDYLRCRLRSLTDENAVVEVRLEEATLERSRIARIIWLDPPDNPSDGADAQDAPPQRDRPRVQAVQRDGVRLTFYLDRLEVQPAADNQRGKGGQTLLIGESDVLAACSVAVDSIDMLLLGDRIEQARAELSYQRWKMQNAPAPRDAADSEAGDASTNFPLVGQPAPPLKLPFYSAGADQGGKEFQIEDYRGEVLVLDFWASWCGPCMQVMPVVDQVGEDFADRGVKVVAVNLQEGAEEVTAALDRLQLKPHIALDRDGVAAQRYQVSGIPQTVVIGRDGRVANVFVGGGAQYEARLRAAIEAAVAAEDVE